MNIRNINFRNICKTCGTRYKSEKFNEEHCAICQDGRQYVNPEGQQWVSYSDLLQKHSVRFHKIREDLYEVSMNPSFAIGQRAFLILTPQGNILWDCIPVLDEAATAFINSIGGLKAIAISHPHYYSTMATWAQTFHCPVYLHQNDKKWVMDDEDLIEFWSAENKKLITEITLVHTGGHFPGSTVLLYESKNYDTTIFVGDTFYISLDKKHISAMYSYPNNIPLDKTDLSKTFQRIEKLEFDSILGAFNWQHIFGDAKQVFNESFRRYKKIYSN